MTTGDAAEQMRALAEMVQERVKVALAQSGADDARPDADARAL